MRVRSGRLGVKTNTENDTHAHARWVHRSVFVCIGCVSVSRGSRTIPTDLSDWNVLTHRLVTLAHPS